MQVREKVGKSRFTVFFPMICGSGGLTSRLAKAAGAEPSCQMRDKKLHALVARSTCPSQHVQITPFSDHFWKLRCRKSARRCGAKHMSKSKCTKAPHARTLGPLLEVEMLKKRAVVARSTLPSQSGKSTTCTDHFWKLRCRKKARAVAVRSTFPGQSGKNTTCSDHFWKLRCRKSARCCGAKDISMSNDVKRVKK